jgi:hypothetical protein
MSKPKEAMYKTAFSPMFGVYVEITRTYQDDIGEWIFVCNSRPGAGEILTDHLFRKHELTGFRL